MKTDPRKMSSVTKSKKLPPKYAQKPRGEGWVWGTHAVAAAIANPNRRITQGFATSAARDRLGKLPQNFQEVPAKDISQLLSEQAVHQGVAAQVNPLPVIDLEQVLGTARRLVILDQIQDPHNLGAIFRSAAAFGFDGIVLQSRNAPSITGVVAKAAAGAIETVPEIRVVNIARTLRVLDEAGWYSIGLTGDAKQDLAQASTPLLSERLAVVIGAEGAGLRLNVQKTCSVLGRIPITDSMESLNASVAAAIAFYVLKHI